MLHRPGGEAPDEVALQQDEQDYRRERDHDGGGHEVAVLRPVLADERAQ
jgi:hypothetical protein